jgi:glycosyltransferase involved in cell wall biosynthesis
MLSDLMYLKDKNIIILSIVKWGKMRVSKHHYALELAAAGNIVYYVEPPEVNLKTSFQIRKSDENCNLFITTYKPLARGKRFLPNLILKILEWYQSKWLLKKIKIAPDIILSFDPYRFSNLSWFNADVTIFFAADLYKSNHVPGEVLTANFCLGVSTTIVQLLKHGNKKSFLINHGLNSAFVKLAEKQLDIFSQQNDAKSLTIGYTGNLLIGSLNRKAMMQVINEHSEIRFIFWGQYKSAQDNAMVGDANDIWDFITFLERCPNVELPGPKNQNELARELLRADIFWLCYDTSHSWAVDGSNSHKILEYLATGRPVISTYISSYRNTDLLYMQEENDNKHFSDFFKSTFESLAGSENPERVKKRIGFALSNTYRHRINEIDLMISEVKNKRD